MQNQNMPTKCASAQQPLQGASEACSDRGEEAAAQSGETSTQMPQPHTPPCHHPGNRIVTYGSRDSDFESQGVHELTQQDIQTTVLGVGGVSTLADTLPDATAVTVSWEEAPRSPGLRQKRRKVDRSRSLSPVGCPLTLCVTNTACTPASISVTLSADAQPSAVQAGAFTPGKLERDDPVRDATPSIPASLGKSVAFITLAADIPPRSHAVLCRCAPDADTHQGFVYVAGIPRPHPNPTRWRGLVVGLPLAGASGPWLCTQGFGGAGHHRGPSMHHSVDLACDVGTPVVAVGAGVITHADDSGRLGGPHVDLLPEANEVRLRLDQGGVATYLHLAHDSLTVRVGDRVAPGQLLGSSGNVGFSTGPHLHFQINADTEPHDAAESVMFAFRDDRHKHGVVPVAGYHFDVRGWVS